MSVITVKSAKTDDQANEQPYEALASASTRKPSNLPYYFVLAVTTLLTYFKTSTSSAQEQPAQPEPATQPEEQAEPAPLKIKEFRAKEEKETARQSDVAELEFDSVHIAKARHNVINFPYKVALSEAPINFNAVSFQPEALNLAEASHLPAFEGFSINAPAAKGSRTQPQDSASDRNRAPVQSGPVRLNDLMAGQAVLIGLSELLARTTDADGNQLTISNVRVSSGSVALVGDGVVYSSNRQNTQDSVVITYDVSDGKTVVRHTANFDLDGRTAIVGTAQRDTLVGIDLEDTIIAEAGNDLVDGRAGNDFIAGGAGDDLIMGGAGNDVIQAGEGNDTVFGGSGDDLISGEAGDDDLFGDAGSDTLSGNAGDDLIDGGDDNDYVAGNEGDDALFGGAGDDILLGGIGKDTLTDGSGEDILNGDEGDDEFTLTNDNQVDRLDGGLGLDTLNLSTATTAIRANLTTNTVSSLETGQNAITGVEALRAGSGNDEIVGSTANDFLYGARGSDSIAGEAGDDLVEGGDGVDTLTGGAGNDVLLGGADADSISGDIGDDTVDGGDGADSLSGGTGNDALLGGADGDTLADGAGADSLSGGDGADRFVLVIDEAVDTVDGGEGLDVVDMSSRTVAMEVNMQNGRILSDEAAADIVQNVEVIITGSGSDALVDALAELRFDAGAGNDTVVVALDGSTDTFLGGAGTDTLDLSAALSDVIVDLIHGSASGEEIGDNAIDSFETVELGSGDDTLIVEASSLTASVTLTGGSGDDSFQFIFESTSEQHPSTLVHQILDFMVGDQLVVADYQFRRVADANGGSRIENVYEPNEDEFVLRLRDIHSGEMHYAVVEVDRDHDGNFEFSVEMFEGSNSNSSTLPPALQIV
ncbi:MAG: calcium-binding protein [Rhizobiaceae bacterium]